MIFRFETKKKKYALSLTLTSKRNEFDVVGYSNRCEDGRYIVFLDYDGLEYNWIEGELIFLQEKYNLGDFYIFSTGNGFHAVCIDKLSVTEYLSLLNDSSVDQNYKRVPIIDGRKQWILRITPKGTNEIKFLNIIKSNLRGRQKSLAHFLMIEKISGIKNPSFDFNHKFDKSEEMILARYRS